MQKKKVFLTDLRGNSLWVLNPCFFLKSLCFIQEWDDYRENKKDYSGLKIENLKIEEQISEDEEEETEINEVSVEKKIESCIFSKNIREMSEN